MKFKSKISNSSIFGLSLFALFFIGLAIYFWFKNPEINFINIIICSCSICGAAFFLSFYKTSYEINSSDFQYKSGFYKGKIKIDSIHKIDLVHSIWNVKYILILSSSFAPALGNQGLMIYFNKNNEMYISPERIEPFLEELLKFNPNIKINRN